MALEDTVRFELQAAAYAKYSIASESQPGLRYFVLLGNTVHPTRCSCPAGVRDVNCKHVRAVLQVHDRRMRQNQQALRR